MAIHPLDIPLGHLYSRTPFPQVEYSPEQEEMVNLIANREDYTQGKQNDQVGKLLADVKTSEIIPDLQQRAVERIQNFTDEFKNLYKGQKNQLKLSIDNQLKASMLKQKLMQDLSSMEQITKDYYKENQNLINYVKDELITPEEAILAEKEFRNALRTPGVSFMDMPFFSTFMAQKIKPRETDWQLKLDKLMAVPMANGTSKSKLEYSNKFGRYVNKTDDYDPLPDVLPLVQAYPSIYSGLVRTVGNDPVKQAEYLKGRYGKMGGETFAGSDPNIHINNGSGSDQKNIKQEIPYTLEKGWDYSQLPTADKPRYSGFVHVKDENGDDVVIKIKDAEVNNQFLEKVGGKYKGHIIGEGVVVGGKSQIKNVGDKVQLSDDSVVELDDNITENSLNKKKYIRTFNGNPYIVPEPKKVSTATESAPPAKTWRPK